MLLATVLAGERVLGSANRDRMAVSIDHTS